MPHCDLITGLDEDGTVGDWLLELDLDGTPILDRALIPAATMSDVVPVWSIHLVEPLDLSLIVTAA